MKPTSSSSLGRSSRSTAAHSLSQSHSHYTRLRPISSSGSGSGSGSDEDGDEDEDDDYRPKAEYHDIENQQQAAAGATLPALKHTVWRIRGRRRALLPVLLRLGAFFLIASLFLCWVVPAIPYWLGLAERYTPRAALPPASASSPPLSGTVSPPPRYQTTPDEEAAYKLGGNRSASAGGVAAAATEALSWDAYQTQLDDFLSTALADSPYQVEFQDLLRSRYFSSASASSSQADPIPPSIWQTAKNAQDFEAASSRSFWRLNSGYANVTAHSSAPGAGEHWTEHLVADPEPTTWATRVFGPRSALTQSWRSLTRGVMRADVWRYAVLGFEGGVYGDLDTTNLAALRTWTVEDEEGLRGALPPKIQVWDVGAPDHLRLGPPQLIVGIEADALGVYGWENFWPRPVQIVQWTFAGARGHPITLDVLRRIHTTLGEAERMRAENRIEAERLRAQAHEKEQATMHGARARNAWWWPFGGEGSGSTTSAHLEQEADRLEALDPFASSKSKASTKSRLHGLVSSLPFVSSSSAAAAASSSSSDKDGKAASPTRASGSGQTISVVEATGPGVWTDAVFAYLSSRYGIHWSQLHNLTSVARIGEVAVVPLTGFSPTDDKEGRTQRWERIGIRRGPMAQVGGWGDRLAFVHHAFAGSWRKAGVDTNA
ncbi:hypothetical protein OC844_006123 [Tilletia horrida]|nr:hypothetical protein OC844_006123 [Tilletia horrida]